MEYTFKDNLSFSIDDDAVTVHCICWRAFFYARPGKVTRCPECGRGYEPVINISIRAYNAGENEEYEEIE